MDADSGSAARRGNQPAAGQYLSAPAGRANGGAWLSDSALCGRLRGSVPEPRGGYAALAEIRRWVEANGLALHPDKTYVGDCRQPGEGFDFLGYRFDAGRRWVRKKSLKRFKDAIRAKTGRSRGDSLARIVADLNPALKGCSATSSMPIRPNSVRSTASSAGDYGRCCASRTSVQASVYALTTVNAGQTPSSQLPG
jgi:hypothetical protein